MFFGLLLKDPGELLQVDRCGEKADLQGHLIKPSEHEAGEALVLFEVAEGRFHLHGSGAAVHQSLFAGEPFAGLCLELVEPMVHLDDPIALGLVACTIQGALGAVARLIARDGGDMSGLGR